MSNKWARAIVIVSCTLIAAFMLTRLVTQALHIYFLYDTIDTVLGVGFLVSIVALAALGIRKIKRGRLRVILTVVTSLCLAAVLWLSFMMFAFAGALRSDIIARFDSPSGRNHLVVREGGFTSAAYTANPVKWGIFMVNQDNGFVSHHEDWGGSKATVTWESEDKAIVKIHATDGLPSPGSNPNNEIVVTFD